MTEKNSLKNKIQRIESLLCAAHFDALAMIPSPSFVWLTGMEKHLMERPTVLFVVPGKPLSIVAPDFEKSSFRTLSIEHEIFCYEENPAEWGKAFQAAGEYLGLTGKKIAVEPLHFRFYEYDLLKQNLAGSTFVSAEEIFRALRISKSESEITAMRKAGEIACSALEGTLAALKPGMSEKEIAADLFCRLLENGSDPNLHFMPSVASGPNSADPHASLTDRGIKPGDILLIDWGARYQGFCSDLTRTFVIGEASPRQQKVYDTVLSANLAAIASVRVGISCHEVDQVARSTIANAGFGKFFTHRVGHGLGLEAHEPPFLHSGNRQTLKEGMCFTIEPGIYLPGEFGVRIEDDLVLTADGGEILYDYPKTLRELHL